MTGISNAFAGKIAFEDSVFERNNAVRENNDGERIDNAKIIKNVADNQTELFRQQSDFIAELRVRQG